MAENKGKSTSNKTQMNMDNPEQYPTENESLFDKFEIEQTVDSIPMEDLKEEQREEKAKHDTKNTSSSEKKYKTGM
ncbi:Uncharacterised protein [Niallia circulans]|jgi:hypothetical protein|uniref:hypothetical protein n=1 Tax=Niallia TaxID=2837506 RepID=UPI00077CD3B0|nr:hypothetical protein [Niallia circulans]MDR4316494.1 hypothetical protein [Niallia circulans]MED3838333.1 hypothetical protein [Niallia circulans]MED4243808.1 hypothetical protein [Niallia circulans]MED4246200.1 hypothetical protein [Niallia circulans]QKH63151.1 hypothetical protein FOC77_22190 [Niallia circulans]